MTVNKCAICGEWCPSYGGYIMHMELMHKPGVIQPKKGRFLTKAEKDAIVVKVEKRLGQQHFFGAVSV